jgi:hypothetical protein
MEKSFTTTMIIALLTVFLSTSSIYAGGYKPSQVNVNKSVNEFYKHMESGGMNEVENYVTNICEAHDKKSPTNFKTLESCVTSDLAAYLFESSLPPMMKKFSSGYFAEDKVQKRVWVRTGKLRLTDEEREKLTLKWLEMTMKSMNERVR